MTHHHHEHDSCCHEGHCHEGHCHEGHCHEHCHSEGGECHQHESYADLLLHLADEAWMEVLKEKIKDHIRQASGEHINQLAKLVSEANHAQWKDKFQKKKDHCEFEERLHALLGSQTQCCNKSK